MRGITQRYPEWQEKGLEVVAFFQSPAESIARFVGRQEAPIPIIPDPKRRVYRQYGVESSWLGYARAMVFRAGTLMEGMFLRGYLPLKMEGSKALLPADFLIGPDLKIEVAYYGKDIGDHLAFEEIDRFLG